MPRSQLVQSLTRGLTILEQIARSESGLSLQELSRRVGLKPTTVHNLVRTLVSQGFVEKVPRPVRYRVGSAVEDLAGLRKSGLLLGRVPAAMTDLFNVLGDATTVFAQVVGGDIRKVMRIIRERPGILEHPQDVSLHPYVSASALLFQSLWMEEERVAYRKRYPFWEYGAHAWGTEERFDAEMEATRLRGFAFVDIEKTGVYTMASPITGAGGQVLAAIGATIPLETADEPRRRQLNIEVIKAAGVLSGQTAPPAAETEPVQLGKGGTS